MLHLYPELVRMDRARDFELSEEAFERYIRDRLPKPPRGGAGLIGYPTAATAAKGAAIYTRMCAAIQTAIFAVRGDHESDTI
jgi:creatinine amidohydrolase/Fe(II)-dependent formamide hydrolase-like protein